MNKIDLIGMGKKAKAAKALISQALTEQKNRALSVLANKLEKEKDFLLAENAEDIKKGKEAGLSPALLDRLSLEGRLHAIAEDVRQLIHLPDPIREIFDEQILPNGLRIAKRRVPIGVLGVIYEARPNVTIDVAALTIKTGNCAILRGGSETLRSNQVVVQLIHQALVECSLPQEIIQLINDPDRLWVKHLLRLQEYVDLIIPRGGAQLHTFCRENSSIPVITGGIGICHLFVDESADLEKSLEVVYNAKTQRPTVCNALDTLLVHEAVASKFLPLVFQKLGRAGVHFKLDQKIAKTFEGHEEANEATDWDTEWLSLVLGVKVVSGLDEAMQHVQSHSSGHSDGIMTENHANAQRFVDFIDSAAVYVNASTRFTDGGQLGLGAEVAISTQKLHARGPMGLKELTSYKWVIQGDYHVRK